MLRLQALFGFGWWADVVNIMMRVTHSLAALACFVVIGLVVNRVTR